MASWATVRTPESKRVKSFFLRLHPGTKYLAALLSSMVILMCGYLRNTDTLPYLHKALSWQLHRYSFTTAMDPHCRGVISGLVVSMGRFYRTPHSIRVQGTAKVLPFNQEYQERVS